MTDMAEEIITSLARVEEADSQAAVAETQSSAGEAMRRGRLSAVVARVGVWGTFAGVVTALAAPLVGSGVAAWLAGGVGAIVGGLGTVGLSALILRRPRVRLTWKATGMLGISFGLYLGAVGILQLFVLPSILGYTPGAGLFYLLPVFGVLIAFGFVLSVVLGIDIMRFLMGQVIASDEAADEI